MAMPNADFRKLIPLLHPRTRVQDMDVLKAWYEAVADAFRAEVSSDLFALWLYGPDGQPILIEPEALAADNLGVPPADPLANQMMLDEVETRVRRAGYGSVLLRPVRHGGQDVALVLFASFSPHVYGMRADQLFDDASSVMAPMLARVIRATGVEEPVAERISSDQVVLGPPPPETREQSYEGAVFEGLSDAIAGAGTPRDLMLAISFALQATLPHDSYDLLIPDTTGEQYYRLGLHGHGALWGDPSLTIPRAQFDLERLYGEHGGFVLDDATNGDTIPVPPLITVRGEEGPPRSVVAVRLRVVERAVGYLLLGSSG
ncbi:MAG TPA: hypothetical protein VG817_00210, partial [Gemmatimonadales bacterium]|nr:hypothetical protein [Gemmatimonadales bacterium]